MVYKACPAKPAQWFVLIVNNIDENEPFFIGTNLVHSDWVLSGFHNTKQQVFLGFILSVGVNLPSILMCIIVVMLC